MELYPRRGWKRTHVGPGRKITIKPGEMVLGRTCERFRMPADCLGLIEGRSSYARLGLAVHATGGFINPGWSGHMPLTLFNHNAVTLRVPVGAPLCQLMVAQLDAPPDQDYSQRDDRKYQNDTGGPSYWWRDGIMREIRDSISSATVETLVFDELDELLSGSDVEDYLIRLEDFISDRPAQSYGNADELLEAFAKKEDRRHRWTSAWHFGKQWAWGLFGALLGFWTLWDWAARWRCAFAAHRLCGRSGSYSFDQPDAVPNDRRVEGTTACPG